MTKIDFEDCGAFVRIDGLRIAKAHIVSWVPRDSRYVIVQVASDANGDNTFYQYGDNAAEVLAALDAAMRGAR